jgi:hypothetical protein
MLKPDSLTPLFGSSMETSGLTCSRMGLGMQDAAVPAWLLFHSASAYETRLLALAAFGTVAGLQVCAHAWLIHLRRRLRPPCWAQKSSPWAWQPSKANGKRIAQRIAQRHCWRASRPG